MSGWTVDTARADYLARQKEADRRYEQRFASQERALAKAETATEKRFESVNEFRAQLGAQAGTFATREKVDGLEARMSEQFALINSRLDRAEVGASARSKGLTDSWGALLGLALLVSSVIAVLAFVTR